MSHFTTKHTLTISCYCQAGYVKALRIIAAKRGTTIGKLVRAALDQCLAEELKAEGQSPFFEADVQSNQQSEIRRNNKS